MPARLPELPALPVGGEPFTRSRALAAGLTDDVLRGPAFKRLFHGVYVRADVAGSASLTGRALLLVHPAGSWVSHTTAARIYGVPVPGGGPEHVSVGHPDHRRHRPFVRVHRPAEPGRPRRVRGCLVSAPHDLFLELATVLGLVDLVVAGDAMVRLGLLTVESLLAHVASAKGRTGRLARRAAALVRCDVESPMESRLRVLLVLAGLPEPTVQYRIIDEHGRTVRRLDLAYPVVRVAVEYDGRQHAEDDGQWLHDITRREALDGDGWRLLVVTSRGVFADPEHTLRRVHALLRERGLPGVPNRLDEEWRLHFPSR